MPETQTIPTNWQQREKLREKGQFWTPLWVAEAMVQYVCGADLIFDPPVGNGVFLNALRQSFASPISFYGFDVDENLLDIDKPLAELPLEIVAYLRRGADLALPERALIKLRRPWYKQEKRRAPEFLFAYLGRRNARFIKNDAQVVPLHCLHCVYTHQRDDRHIERLHEVLNHPDTLQNLHLVSKSYGAGALKAEPQNLKNLPIPDYLVEKYELLRETAATKRLPAQYSLF